MRSASTDALRAPIVLTVQFDEKSDSLFQELRRRNFPPDINYVGAHLTLFHSLPGEQEEAIIRETARLAARTAPLPVAVVGPMKLGRGVALRLESDTLNEIRWELAQYFRPWLRSHDREKFRPHVTVQNKVAPHVADAFYDHIAATLSHFDAIAEGIQLWRYENKRLSPLAAIPFQAIPACAAS